jgi:heme-degrading monooxygenase HmoA
VNTEKKIVIFHVLQYKKWAVFFAFFAMALFNLPLLMNRKVSFYKLMGCGRSGTFDIYPDLHQWCIMLIINESDYKNSFAINEIMGSFIGTWKKLFCTKSYSIVLRPKALHGTWDGKQPFGLMDKNKPTYDGKIAVLTRATIRLRKMKQFWSHVEGVAENLKTQKGFHTSIGVGEIPWKKQATLSIWDSIEDMQAFAYQQRAHAEVVKKTRSEDWYSEDMFVRFEVVAMDK